MKTEEKSASNKKLISLCVIERALEGDIQAINKVLKHYEGYIAKLSIRKMYDEYGSVSYLSCRTNETEELYSRYAKTVCMTTLRHRDAK